MKETVLGNFQRLMKGDENVVIKSTQFLLKHLSESVRLFVMKFSYRIQYVLF